MVDLGLDGGVVVLEPLGDPAGLGRRRTLALDEGEDLVGVGEQLVVTPPRPVEMTPAQMPFAPDQRLAVELAQKSLREDGVFIGMLPVGDYNIAGRQFDVTQGVATQPNPDLK